MTDTITKIKFLQSSIVCLIQKLGTFYKIDQNMNVTMQMQQTQLFNQGTLVDFSISKNNVYLALGGSKGEIMMYNVETDKLEHRIAIDA